MVRVYAGLNSFKLKGFTAFEVPTVSALPHAAEVARRRTFAIISHPDAGKTTLTE